MLELLEDQIFYHSCRISEYSQKLRQADMGIYRKETAQRFEYNRNAHREALHSVIVQWLAEVEKTKSEKHETTGQVVYGRW